MKLNIPQKKCILFLFLSLILSVDTQAQELPVSVTEQIDSLTALVNASNSKEKKSQNLAAIANIYYKEQQLELAIDFFQKSLTYVDKKTHLDSWAELHLNIGQSFVSTQIFKPDSAFHYISQIVPILEKLSPSLRLRSYIELTSIYYTLYSLEEATAYCLKCIDLAETLADKSSLMFCYSRMAAYSEVYPNHKNKIKTYIQKALDLAVEEHNSSRMAYYYLLYSGRMILLNELDLASNALDSCEKYIQLSARNDLLCDMYQNKGSLSLLKKNYKQSERFYIKALTIAQKQMQWNRQMHVPLDLADLEIARQDYDKAIIYSNEAMTVAPDKLTLYELERGHQQFYQAYRQINNFEKALYHFEQWKIYADSSKQLNNLGVIAGLENKYKNKEQQKQIQLQEEEINTQTQQRNLVIGFLLVVTLLLFATLWFYKKMKLSREKMRASREEIKAQNETITQQSQELQELDKMKSRFFANVTHELRTPLTLMLAPIHSAIKSGELNNRNFTFLKTAQQNGKNLLKLISSLLDLSKMESGKIALHEKPELLRPLVHRITAAFESFAQYSNIQFSFQYQADKDLQLELDKEKLEVILNNLLSNALKFTAAKGRVSIHIQDIGNAIKIKVTDTGRGIHPDDLPDIFNRFFQSRQADAPTEGGTGIGLALSQEFVKMMGGKIWVESELGKGSTFSVELPRKEVLGMVEHTVASLDGEQRSTDLHDRPPSSEASVKQSNRSAKPPSTEATVLIVEDNHSLRQYLETILSPYYQIFTAENGQVALETLEKNHCQLIISDIMMPVMDGFQLLKALKNNDKLRHIPVVMLTARADMQDKLKALRIGVDDYLLKPFEEEELLVRIANLLENYEQRNLLNLKNKIEKQANKNKIQETETISQEDHEWLENLENYLKNQLSNTQLSISDIAAEFSMSERSLQRQLKRIVGITPSKYVQEIRLNTARQLLENQTYNTVSKVAYEVGFQNAKTFSRSFKQRFGKLPSEYSNS